MFTSHRITVEDIDGKWRVYRWGGDGFYCHTMSPKPDSEHHICHTLPEDYSLTEVYNACLKAATGDNGKEKAYGMNDFNCNAFVKLSMANLTGESHIYAKAWS